MVTKGCYLGPRPRLCSCDQPVVLVLIVARWLLHLQKEEGGRAEGKVQRETLAEFVPLGFWGSDKCPRRLPKSSSPCILFARTEIWPPGPTKESGKAIFFFFLNLGILKP